MEASTAVRESAAQETRNIIRFEEGIYGFETVRDFLLLQEDETQTIWSLQAADAPYPTLLAVNPFLVCADYRPALTRRDFLLLGSPQEEDLCFLAVAAIKRDLKNSVVNLKSPIVINAKTRTGRQIILEDSSYPVRYKLFRKIG